MAEIILVTDAQIQPITHNMGEEIETVCGNAVTSGGEGYNAPNQPIPYGDMTPEAIRRMREITSPW